MARDVSPERARELFDLSGGTLIRRISRGKAKAGTVAGNRHNAGYLRVRIDGEYHLCHRVVWIMEHGPIPEGYLVDHRNTVRNDNEPSNLRLTQYCGNSQNSNKSTRNTSGHKGVSKHACGKWMVQLNANNQYHYGGLFENQEDACVQADALRQRLHGAFARGEVYHR